MTVALECPDAPQGGHVYGTRTRCLVCGHPAPPNPRPASGREPRTRPGGTTQSGALLQQRVNPDADVAGWGEDGNPWG